MVRNALFASLRAQARSTRTRQQFSNGQRRWASTPSSSSSSSSTGSAQQKANDAFASAQKGLEKATEVAKNIGGGVGDRVGALLGCMFPSYFCIPFTPSMSTCINLTCCSVHEHPLL